MVKSTLSDVELLDVEEVLDASLKDLEKAKTGSSSMIPLKPWSFSFWRVPVREKRWRRIADVPDS